MRVRLPRPRDQGVPGAGDPLVDAVTPALSALGVRPFTPHRARHVRAGNARLVAMTGAALLVLLPFPYVSALALDTFWRVHYYSALLLVPLLLLKLAAAGWRTLRYYTGEAGYRRDGAPHPMPRLTAPVLVAATVVLFGSGVAMMLGASRDSSWSTVHNGAAIIVTGALGLHLLAHLWDTPAEVAADVAPALLSRPVPSVVGGGRRVAATVAAFVIGLIVATVAIPVEQLVPAASAFHHRVGTADHARRAG